MFIAIYDKITGEIRRSLTAPESAVALNVASDEDWLEVSVEMSATHYVDVSNKNVVKIPQAPNKYYDWDVDTKQWVPQVAVARKETVQSAVAEYRRRKELPISYDAKTLDTNEDAREQLMFKAFEFAERARLNQPAGGASRVWENADGTFHVFATDVGFRNWLGGFVITLSDRTAQQRLALRTHVQNIRALTTVEDVLAYDITTGWPT